MPACNLSKSSTLGVDFDGTPGPLTLSIKGTKGDAFFEHVIYDGSDVLSKVSKKVDITLKAGQKLLTIVCLFTDQGAGTADLSEVCSTSSVLDTLRIADPDHGTRTYVISA